MTGGSPPPPARILAVLGIGLLALPLLGLISNVPWARLTSILSTTEVRQALFVSAAASAVSAVCSLMLGLPLAWLLSTSGRGRGLIRALCTLPLVLPPVVGGIALLFAFGRQSVLGSFLSTTLGIEVPFTFGAVVMAQSFVAMPFLVLTVEAALRNVDHDLPEAGRTLGGTELLVFRRVMVPSIRSALVAGVVLSWARAFGEFGATITFAGNFPGRTQTLPLAVYLSLSSDSETANVLALVMVVISLGVLFGLRRQFLGTLFRSQR